MAQRSNTLDVKLPILGKISVDYQFINVFFRSVTCQRSFLKHVTTLALSTSAAIIVKKAQLLYMVLIYYDIHVLSCCKFLIDMF